MMKKGEGLSLSIIVIAVLCLIVLVIMILIFTGKIGEFGAGIDFCSSECVPDPTTCTGKGQQAVYKSKCSIQGTAYVPGSNYCCTATTS